MFYTYNKNNISRDARWQVFAIFNHAIRARILYMWVFVGVIVIN